AIIDAGNGFLDALSPQSPYRRRRDQSKGRQQHTASHREAAIFLLCNHQSKRQKPSERCRHPNLFGQLALRRAYAALALRKAETAQKLPRIAEAFREHSIATGRVHGCLLCSLFRCLLLMGAEWSTSCCNAAW